MVPLWPPFLTLRRRAVIILLANCFSLRKKDHPSKHTRDQEAFLAREAVSCMCVPYVLLPPFPVRRHLRQFRRCLSNPEYSHSVEEEDARRGREDAFSHIRPGLLVDEGQPGVLPALHFFPLHLGLARRVFGLYCA